MSKEAKERFTLAGMLESRMHIYQEYERQAKKRRARAARKKEKMESKRLKEESKKSKAEMKERRKRKSEKRKAVKAFFDLAAVESDRSESESEGSDVKGAAKGAAEE